MARVFVVQEQHRFCHTTKRLVPKFDIKPAEKYGEISYLLSPSASPFHPESVLEELHEKLKDFGPDDCILLIGNPVLIGWVMTIAADRSDNGLVRALQWSGKDQAYILVEATIFPFT